MNLFLAIYINELCEIYLIVITLNFFDVYNFYYMDKFTNNTKENENKKETTLTM